MDPHPRRPGRPTGRTRRHLPPLYAGRAERNQGPAPVQGLSHRALSFPSRDDVLNARSATYLGRTEVDASLSLPGD
jgi:hypothetical protein